MNQTLENDNTNPRNTPPTKFSLRSLPSNSSHVRTNDDVHTSITLDPLVKTILDTPQLQRLRDLKQLGLASYAYVNATHSRFEHSLGVMHLAEKLITTIKKRQPVL